VAVGRAAEGQRALARLHRPVEIELAGQRLPKAYGDDGAQEDQHPDGSVLHRLSQPVAVCAEQIHQQERAQQHEVEDAGL
jgi:hypothetical protein